VSLDAAAFLEEARAELEASTDPDSILRDFYESDPAIKAEPFLFRHPRRYDFELIYTIHKKVTEEAYQRIEDLFEKTWPDEVDTNQLEKPEKVLREYYGQFRERLLEDEGTSWAKLQKEREAGESEDEIVLTPEREEALAAHGWDLVKHRVDREIRVRTLLQFLKFKASEQESESIKKLFDLLAANDDPEDPICSTEPGKGLIVYRRPKEPLSNEEIDDLEDSGERFTHNVRLRITGRASEELPELGLNAESMGARGFGRMVYRLIDVERERRKSFDELTEAERADVLKKFYLPAKARERAAERLRGFRKRLQESEDPAGLLAKAGTELAVSVRVVEDEWITARDRYMPAPARERYWRDEYLHMRDRDFLRRRLADLFAADRVKRELEAGSVLEVQTDVRNEAEDPGASYLVLLRERRKPSAETMPREDLETYVNLARRRRASSERQRWESDFLRLKTQFEMEFFGDMKDSIEEELQKRKESAPRMR
jgi:hypothetical protein